MLTKKICVKCIMNSSPRDPWKHTDTNNWEGRSHLNHRAFVSCPSGVSTDDFNRAYVDSPPPSWCPYRLEHAVAETINA